MRAAAIKTFSCTDRPLNTFGTCVLMPTPRRAISLGLRAGDVLAAEPDRPRTWCKLACQHLEERALARAVRADQATQFQFTQREIDRFDGSDAAEAHRRGAGFEQRNGHGRTRLRARRSGRRGRTMLEQSLRAAASQPARRLVAPAVRMPPASTPSIRLAFERLLRADQLIRYCIANGAEDRSEQCSQAAEQDEDDYLRGLRQAEHGGGG